MIWMVDAFDLNSGEVLEHWPVAFAVRELLANALDEQILTNTQTPDVLRLGLRRWAIRDYGRGLQYRHLTQAESDEKLAHPDVIGKFGFGLNDALAVLNRHGISVRIRSRHGNITTRAQAKAGFADVVTLHGIVEQPDDPSMVGTEVLLEGVDDEDIATAKDLFLRYSNDVIVEDTRFGQVIRRSPVTAAAGVYVKGLRVADEPKFLFSYNVTAPDAKLNRALNRERTAVGRSAYTDRIKDILKSASSLAVLGGLAEDISNFDKGEAMHDELRWKDVAVYACRALQRARRTVFVTAGQMGDSHVDYAKADGYSVIVVPNDIATALNSLTDLDGEPMLTLNSYVKQRADSFEFDYVNRADLTEAERAVFDTAPQVAELAEFNLDSVDLRLSATLRPDAAGHDTVGLWTASERSIVIKRSQLHDPRSFAGTLLHEICHATSGETDRTLEFEEALTELLGSIATRSLAANDGSGSSCNE